MLFLQLYFTLVATAVFIIPAILIAICYIIIVVIIWKRSSSSFGKQYSDVIKEKSTEKSKKHKKGDRYCLNYSAKEAHMNLFCKSNSVSSYMY